MKLAAALILALPIIAEAKSRLLERKRKQMQQRRNLKGEKGGKKTKNKAKATFTPGSFEWGYYIRSPDGGKVAVADGLTGRNIAITGENVTFADGSVSELAYHIRPDGAGLFTKDDGSGYYYVSNSEYGDAEDEEYWGGVYSLELNNDHDPVGYKQILSGTVDNCAGGKTPWGTWVSCEEEGYKDPYYDAQCWQTDPAGEIASERTAVTPGGGNYEAFAWDESTEIPRGYTSDDAHPGNKHQDLIDHPGVGAVVRYTPSAASLECWAKETKAERWCTLNEGTTEFLKLHPASGGANYGTYEWVAKQEDANPELYRKSEGIETMDGILIFAAKEDRQLFYLDLETMEYEQWSSMSGTFDREPDNIRLFNGMVFVCSDDDYQNGVWGVDDKGAFNLFKEITLGTEAAGLDFSEDGMYIYVNYQGHGTWQFWREDGLSFYDDVAGIVYA